MIPEDIWNFKPKRRSLESSLKPLERKLAHVPSALPESAAYLIWVLLHKYILQHLIHIVLGAHILGVLKHHFIDQHHNAINRIVP